MFYIFEVTIHTFRQARTMLTKQDVRGMTYLMYAINPEAMSICPSLEASNLHIIEEGVPRKLQCQSCTLSHRRTHTFSPSIASRRSGGGESTSASHSVDGQNNGLDTYAASHWVPVVKRVLEYARGCLWMPEVHRATRFICRWTRIQSVYSTIPFKQNAVSSLRLLYTDNPKTRIISKNIMKF